MASYKCLLLLYITVVMVSCILSTVLVQQCPGELCNRFCHKPEGECLNTGKCLCKDGYTGPNPTKNSDGKTEADHCMNTCDPVAEGVNCTAKCHRYCQSQSGNCRSVDGKCLCWWGWTGPNALYIKNINDINDNRILADTCNNACNHGPFYNNPSCAQTSDIIPEYL